MLAGAEPSCLLKAPLPVLLLWYFWLRELMEHLVMCSGNCSTILDKKNLKRPFCTQLVYRQLALSDPNIGIGVLPVPGACSLPLLNALSPQNKIKLSYALTSKVSLHCSLHPLV